MEMSMKRMLNSKKAISPSVATLLLIVIDPGPASRDLRKDSQYTGTTTQQAGVILKQKT
jgi:hypothetical protein